MKFNTRQKIGFVLIIIANLTLWIIPSDVVELIARDRQTLLGRYSRTHFYWIAGIAVISMISVYIDCGMGEKYKKRWFQVIALLIFLVPTLAALDFMLRTDDTSHYIKETIAYHRPPNSLFSQTYTDKPEAYRTYPNAPAGYGTVDCTLQTDSWGYRNQTHLDQYDIVALGDSFTEGSNVSDDDPWPVKLAKLSGLNVYNMGMSGYDPLQYHESLKEHGLSLKPRFVLCMLYEGNDFRSAKSDAKRMKPNFSVQLKTYFKQSPLLNTFDETLIRTLGPINRDAEVKGSEILDWLPLAIGQGNDIHHYAFAPKQLRDLLQSEEDFAVDRHWLNPQTQLQEVHTLCEQAGARLIVTLAPTKAHVTLPLVQDHLDANKVHAFMDLRFKEELPQADLFLSQLLQRTEAKETVIRQWCEKNNIAFVSITQALRDATRAGVQTYYTYDQHWTPLGHETAARTIHQYLKEHFQSDDARMTSR